MLLLFMTAGVIIGTFVGDLLARLINSPIFTYSFSFGTSGTPIDLSVLRICFGISIKVNFGTVLGIIAGLLMYFKK